MDSRRRARLVVGGLWVVVVLAWVARLAVTGTSPTVALQDLIDVLDGAWWAIPAFIVVSTLRPLLLFPASLLTVAAGILFGPVVGVLVAAGGANLSALVAFWVARTFSPDRLAAAGDDAVGVLARWSARMRDNSFTTVMVMRLAFLPYDLVNYVAGCLRINVVAFLAATAIGSLPGTVSFVLAGASVERLDAGVDGFDPTVFGASVALFVASIGVAKALEGHARA